MAKCLLPFTVFFTLFSLSSAQKTLTASKPIRDGETLVSTGGRFKLGFFSPGASKNRYIGIWYSFSEETVVWVANREQPLTNSTGVLEIRSDGNLVLRYQAGAVVWSTGSLSNEGSSEAQLLESGNLVLKDGKSENVVWQSFDYPTDTLLGGMILGWDSKTGLNRRLRSWKGADDPSPGNYSFELDRRGSPQGILKHGSSWVFRTGPWNGFGFSGIPEMKSDMFFTYQFVYGNDAMYYSFETKNSSTITRLVAAPSGFIQRYVWINQGWSLYWSGPYDQCDDYAGCGANGVCDTNFSPSCQCLKGFQPKSSEQWNLRDGSSGCVRKTSLDCNIKAGFLNVTQVKLPDTSNAIVNTSMSLEDCRVMCLMNCSCMAYAMADIRGAGSGCIIWVDNLLDLRLLSNGLQDIHIRMVASALDDGPTVLTSLHGSNNLVVVIVSTSVAFAMLLLGFSGCYIRAKKKGNCVHMKVFGTKSYHSEEICREDLSVPLYDLSTIATATNNFSQENKLGEGGFGPVYKGKLEGGQYIGVKRLSKDSVQGLDEFKNEVLLIAKLQHRNLVRLLGCCTQGEERMLIYEYMHNKSLDNFIYDETRRPILNWQLRFNIIMGIARGLLYLHQDSRFKIVHRDLKASNILLDEQMNPKISDFGVARVSVDGLKDVKTRRVIGTYGYMSPEYAMDGIFSVKSDVFSFGVLVLEIISGKKNRGFYHFDTHLNLLGHAWSLWKERNGLGLVDESIGCSCPASEVLKCIQVGLLCVQERAAERPTMSSVVFMLGSPNATLPQPKQPGFCELRSPNDSQRYPYKQEEISTSNEVTMTMLESR